MFKINLKASTYPAHNRTTDTWPIFIKVIIAGVSVSFQIPADMVKDEPASF
jgi:hypothetical protein